MNRPLNLQNLRKVGETRLEKPVESSIVKQLVTWWTNRAFRTGTSGIPCEIQVFIEFSRGDQGIRQRNERKREPLAE